MMRILLPQHGQVGVRGSGSAVAGSALVASSSCIGAAAAFAISAAVTPSSLRASGYLAVTYPDLILDAHSPLKAGLGMVIVAIVFEATRRLVGWTIVITCALSSFTRTTPISCRPH